MLEIPSLMRRLSEDRPIFHSEADFQFELAWLIHSLYPDARIRLERPLKIAGAARAKLDLWVELNGLVDAIELKYQTTAFSADVGGESFSLASKGAEDNLGYDFLNDLVRVEHIASVVPNCIGHAVLLSNEALWNVSPRAGEFNKDAFRIHEGREVSGTLSWREPERVKERSATHELRGSYLTSWDDYSDLGGNRGRFRYLYLRADPVNWLSSPQEWG